MSNEKPPLPEPATPMWLPALGAVLFLLAGVWWAARPADKPESPAAEAGADAGAANAPATNAPAANAMGAAPAPAASAQADNPVQKLIDRLPKR
jgi:hypothetical protein